MAPPEECQFIVRVRVRMDRWQALSKGFGGNPAVTLALEQAAGAPICGPSYEDYRGDLKSPAVISSRSDIWVSFYFRYPSYNTAVTARRRIEARHDGWEATMREAINQAGPIWETSEAR